MATLRQIEKRMDKIQRKVSTINNLLGIMEPLIKPLEWSGLTERDQKVLAFLISQPRPKRFTSTQIAEAIGLQKPKVTGRVHVWNSLKRIKRIGRKKGKKILNNDRRANTWEMNRDDFMFPEDLEQNN